MEDANKKSTVSEEGGGSYVSVVTFNLYAIFYSLYGISYIPGSSR
jgi:hypothetical protein